MLDLASSHWKSLTDAYGSADQVPELLSRLSAFPAEGSSQSEPWFDLWSRLCHQGDVYPASFAAVPHIINTLARDPARATLSFFLLPACIEIARHKHQVSVPDDLKSAYDEALAQIPSLAAKAAQRQWDGETSRSVLAAIAAAKSQHDIAELLTEVDAEDIGEVLEWYSMR